MTLTFALVTGREDDPLWIDAAPYAVAVISLVVSVIVVALSTWLQRSADRSSWLRDNRQRVYSDYLQSARVANEAVTETWTLLRENDYESAAFAYSRIGADQLSHLRDEIELLGPDEIANLCDRHFYGTSLYSRQLLQYRLAQENPSAALRAELFEGRELHDVVRSLDEPLSEFVAAAKAAIQAGAKVGS